jgi:hypothetical protein
VFLGSSAGRNVWADRAAHSTNIVSIRADALLASLIAFLLRNE